MSRAYVIPEPEKPAIAPEALIQVCLNHHARRAARAVSRVFDLALRPVGLSAGQFNILAAIGAGGSASAAAVARDLAMDPATLSRNLKPLRDLGYIDGKAGVGRRAGTLSLTVSGAQAFHAALPLWRGAQSQLSGTLGGSATGTLLQLLERLTMAAEAE